MTTFQEALAAVEAFNVRACDLTGAGRGAATTQDAIEAHRLYMREHASEARELIRVAQSFGARNAFLAGFASYVDFYASWSR
jgi:hypothetical protein